MNLRDFMKEKYGGIDVLVNNAAIAFKNSATEPMGVQAEVTCKTNYWSTKNVCDLLFPILRPGARDEAIRWIQSNTRNVVFNPFGSLVCNNAFTILYIEVHCIAALPAGL